MPREGENPELEASIQSMELAFRMQTEALDAFDVRKESQATRERYGDGYFARGCLMARRLLERGVRVVQVFFGNRNPWTATPTSSTNATWRLFPTDPSPP